MNAGGAHAVVDGRKRGVAAAGDARHGCEPDNMSIDAQAVAALNAMRAPAI
jgi:hypothetical protein